MTDTNPYDETSPYEMKVLCVKDFYYKGVILFEAGTWYNAVKIVKEKYPENYPFRKSYQFECQSEYGINIRLLMYFIDKYGDNWRNEYFEEDTEFRAEVFPKPKYTTVKPIFPVEDKRKLAEKLML